MPGQGYNSWASVAPELVAYGTKSASTYHYFDYVRESIKMDRPPVLRKCLRGGTHLGMERFFYQGVKKCGGDIAMEFNFQGMLQFLKHAMGGYAFAADTPVTGANTHTFTLANALPNYGLTMEISRADLPAGKVFLYTGGKVNELTIGFKTGDILELIAGMIFKDETPNATPVGTPTYAADYPVLWRYAGSLTLCGETAVPFDSGSVKLNNALSVNRFLMGNTLPSPIREGYRPITGQIVGEYDSLALYTKYLAQTAGAFDLTLTSDSLITGTTFRGITIHLPSIILDGETPNVDGPGIVPYTVPFRCQYDGTATSPMSIYVVSTEGTLL